MTAPRILQVAESLGKPGATLIHAEEMPPQDYRKLDYTGLSNKRRELQKLVETWTKDAQQHRERRQPELAVAFEDKMQFAKRELEAVQLALRARIARDLAHP